MAFFKYEQILKYLGIQGSVLNPRLETIYDNNYNLTGNYVHYLNLQTNKEEIIKLSMDTQKLNYEEPKEIYKDIDNEKSKTLKASLAAKFNLKLKDIHIYASFPITKINKNISSLRNFEVSETPDKYYWDISDKKTAEGIYEFLELDENIKQIKDANINFIVNFDSETLTKLGIFYHISGTKAGILKVLNEADFIDEITPRDKLVAAFDSLAEEDTEYFYTIGLQVPFGEKQVFNAMRKFVFTCVKSE